MTEVALTDKPLVWLKKAIKTPPLSKASRIEAGTLLRRLQQGESLSMPHSRPMPSVGKRCHELRINDKNKAWRIMYRIDDDAIIVVEVFEKKTKATPATAITICKARLRAYDEI